MAKKFLIGVLILFSAYAAILVFFGNGPQISPNLNQQIAVGNKTEINKPNSPLKNNLSQSPNQKISGANAQKEGASDENVDIIAQNISAQNVDAENLMNQYLADGIKNFDAQNLKPTIKRGDLKIVNASETAAQNYINNVGVIYNKNFADPDSMILTESSSLEMPVNFDLLINVYQKTIDEFYKTAVPENLVFAHQEQIALLTAQKNALKIVQDYEEDPLKALLAFKAGEEFTQEFANLQKSLSQVIE